MSDDDNELTTGERRALDAWAALPPPSDFAHRVLAARDDADGRGRWRRPLIAGGIAACVAAAAVALIVTRSPSQSSTGSLDVTTRTTAKLGTRGVAVAEPRAAITWRISDDGATSIDHTAGDVFYRVEPGRPFVVHTPAGDVRVTGTCFRIEVTPMNKKHMVLSGALGAAIAATVTVTVYEGHVIAQTHGQTSELVAGSRATIGPDGRTTLQSATASGSDASIAAIAAVARIDPNATREQLLARAGEQQLEIGKLRTRLADLEKQGGGRGRGGSEDEEGRDWYDPSPERLKQWAAECRVRVDEPGLSSFTPLAANATSHRGLEPGEIAAYNAAMTEVQQRWAQLVRALYLEATGDTAGTEVLSVEAMRREIEEKSPDGDHLLEQLARERAGLTPVPTDPSRMTPFERLQRAYLQLGDQSEAALAKRLGPERARQIRSPEGWGSRSEMAGCPK